MPMGITRGVVGGLTLAFAGLIGSAVEDMKAMTPNEIAGRAITESKRMKILAAKKAIAERSGPVFDQAVKACESENKRANGNTADVIFINNGSKALLYLLGQSTDFNFNACVDHKLLDESFFIGPLPPEKGNANEQYKAQMISRGAEVAYSLGALGGVLVLAGGLGYVRGRRKNLGPV